MYEYGPVVSGEHFLIRDKFFVDNDNSTLLSTAYFTKEHPTRRVVIVHAFSTDADCPAEKITVTWPSGSTVVFKQNTKGEFWTCDRRIGRIVFSENRELNISRILESCS